MNFEVFANSYEPAHCFRKASKSNLRAALLGSSQLKLCLSFDLDVVDVPSAGCSAWLERTKIDFMLIEACWKDSTGNWSIGHADPEEQKRLLQLIELVRKAGIPMIFWHTTDATYAQFYQHLMKHMDYVFCANLEACSAYSQRKKNTTIYLPPAVQPAIHNPYQFKQRDKFADFEPFLQTSWADILEYPAVVRKLENARCYGSLSIIEPDWKLSSEKLEETGQLSDSIRGYVTYLQLIQAFKNHHILYMPLPSLSSFSRRAWRSLEALSSGMHVVFEGPFDLPGFPTADYPISINGSVEDLAKYSNELQQDEFSFRARSHTARRNLWDNHTYRDRLQSISDTIGIPFDLEKKPLATTVLITKRPELLDNCISSFTKQGYDNKELIIVLNSPDKAIYELALSKIKHCPDIRIIHVHCENNIGVCLNLGISQATGKYWLKMDDDDYYGENYIADTMKILVEAGASLCAKPPVYVYLEGSGEVFQRDVLENENIFQPSRQGAGATFAGTVDIVKRQPFSTDRRGDVDTDFIKRITSAGEVVVLGDRFNFVIHRAAQQGFHTWRLSDADFKRHAKMFGDRSKMEDINL